MFNIGDRVKCIDDSMKADILNLVKTHNIKWVTKGEIYTIRDIHYNDDITIGILLEEISNPYFYIPLINRTQELAFADFRFIKSETTTEKHKIEAENEVCI